MRTEKHRFAWLALGLSWLALVSSASAQTDEVEQSTEQTSSSESAGANAGANGEPEGGAAAAAAPSSEAKGERVRIQPFVGFGFGTRSFERPTPIGGQHLPTVWFPAADIGLGVVAWPRDSFALGILLRYQTSIGMTVEERPPFALPNETSARSERGELSVAPTFKLWDAEDAFSVAVPVGIAIRALRSTVHGSMTPSYGLIGPELRAELIAPLTSAFSLRLGPEFQWILAINHSLRADGVDSQAYAFGGEAQASLRLGSSLALELCYRESHASASSVNGGPVFKDVERYLSGRVAGIW